MEGPFFVTLAAALALATIHLLVPRLRYVDERPRNVLLAVAGGVSVAYVVVQLLPEIAAAQRSIELRSGTVVSVLDHHAYLLALAGLAVAYGVARERSRAAREGDELRAEARWLSLAAFSAYSAIIGYLIVHRIENALPNLFFFTVAIGAHLAANDYNFSERYGERFERVGRFLLAGAVLLGWLVGVLTAFSEVAVGLLLAFVGGGVLLNAIVDDLPEESTTRFSAFALGALGCAVALQFL